MTASCKKIDKNNINKRIEHTLRQSKTISFEPYIIVLRLKIKLKAKRRMKEAPRVISSPWTFQLDTLKTKKSV